MTTGESVRILRELKDLSQNELAAAAGIPQSTISAMKNDRVRHGVDRAKVLARALRCHPAELVSPTGMLNTTRPHNDAMEHDAAAMHPRTSSKTSGGKELPQ